MVNIEAYPEFGTNYMVLRVDEEVGRYYRRLFLRTFGVKLEKPVHGSHITVSRTPNYLNVPFPDVFTVDISPQAVYYNGESTWPAFWLNVSCEAADIIREAYGNPISLHYTIGYIKYANEQTSI